MNSKKTVVFAAVLAVLVVFYYFYEVKGGKTRQEAKERSERVLDFDHEKLQRFTLKMKDRTLSAEKSGTEWKLTEPLQTPGDGKFIELMLKAVATRKRSRIVEEDAKDIKPYGLDKPRIAFTFQLEGEETPHTLEIGAENPAGAAVYLRTDQSKSVQLSEKTLFAALDQKLYDLRDKAIVHFKPELLQRIELYVGDLQIFLQRGDADKGAATAPAADADSESKAKEKSQRKGEEKSSATAPSAASLKDSPWRLLSPLKAAASQRDVENFIKHLQETKVQKFVKESTDELAPYGLDAPRVKVALHGGGERISFILGNLDEKSKGVFARRAGSKQIYLLGEEFLKKFPTTVKRLRDRNTFKFDRDKVAELEFEAAGEHVRVQKKGKDDWDMLLPEADKGDEVRISSFLWDLNDIVAEVFVVESHDDLAKYGLDNPQRWYRVRVEGEEALQELRFGKTSDDGKLIYATMTGWKNVIGVNAKDLEPIFNRNTMMLRFKKLWVFKNADVERVSLLYDGTTYDVKRSGDEWKLASHNDERLQSWKGAGLLYQLSDAEYASIVDREGADDSKYGFDAPKVRATLWGRRGKEIGTIVIGNQIPGTDDKKMYYVRASGKTGIYGIEEEFLEELQAETKELMKGLTS